MNRTLATARASTACGIALYSAVLLAVVCGVTAETTVAAVAQSTAVSEQPRPLSERDLMRVRNPILRINVGGHSGTIRALAFTPDSQRLCSAGLDKDVAVWNLQVLSRDLRRVFLRERTIRWQVGRGPRGTIQAMAAARSDGLLAFGGYGAMGSLGEIMLVDPVNGKLAAVLDKHRQSIASLSYSADGRYLASSDTAGEAILWRRPASNHNAPSTSTQPPLHKNGGSQEPGAWTPLVLQDADALAYGKSDARRIAASPKFRPIVIAGNRWVVLPAFAGFDGHGRLQWKLRQVRLDDSHDSLLLPSIHHGLVTALATSRDGSRLASADWQGNLFIWNLAAGRLIKRIQPRATVLCLSFSPDGKKLLAGTALTKTVDGKKPKSQLQIWDLDTFEHELLATQPDHIHACSFSPDGTRIAYTGGAEPEVFLQATAPAADAKAKRIDRLGGKSRRVLRVAFASQEPFYRIALGTKLSSRDGRPHVSLQQCFDIDQSDLVLGKRVADRQNGRPDSREAPLLESDWLADDWLAGRWTAKRKNDGTLQLFHAGRPKGVVDLRSQLPELDEGSSVCMGWLADASARPIAVLVGTNRQNSVYACRLVDEGVCPIIRHFRGHSDVVTSIGVSRDLAYVATGSFDGTARLWSLAALDADDGRDCYSRWGAAFEIRSGQLVVSKIHPAGPLFRKGMREGDTLDAVQWPVDNESNLRVEKPGEILEQLAELPWGTQVLFDYSRRGSKRTAFQLMPAWQPLASLLVSSQRQWAFWTPEGYYNASTCGYTLFGWQINRGLWQLPSFYRADQFARRLERPDVMRLLLPAGSLQTAFEQASTVRGGRPPVTAELQQSLPAQIASTPDVEILSPQVGTTLNKDTAVVTAKIRVPAACKLDQTRVFANGVVAAERRLVKQEETDEGHQWTFTWDVRLPSDRTNLIQVIAGTDAQTTQTGTVLVKRAVLETHPNGSARKKPRLFLLAMAVDDYADREIPDLNCCLRDAAAVVDVARHRMTDVYDVCKLIFLRGEEVTTTNLRRALNELKTTAADASPDDLVLLYLAGHGVADQRSKQYYFIGHSALFTDVCAADYRDCISWGDFRPLADIPCRKLALLDTCHSGAVQAEDDYTSGLAQDPKAAVRKFQEDVIFTVTAAAGDEKAVEDPQTRHGIFTMYVIKAVDGAAVDEQQEWVTLGDMIRYVKRLVPQRIAELTDGRRTQHPTAAPHEILEYVSLPLTSAGNR